MKLESYWLDTAPAFTAGAEGSVAGRADVVVVGAGFTGLSAALALAKRGASVVVLEAGRVVGEASGRNGGHCNSGLAHDFGALAGRLGVEKARAFYQAYDASAETVETIVRQENKPERNPWRTLEWPAAPGHFGKPWFLPFVGAYYRFQDWLH